MRESRTGIRGRCPRPDLADTSTGLGRRIVRADRSTSVQSCAIERMHEPDSRNWTGRSRRFRGVLDLWACIRLNECSSRDAGTRARHCSIRQRIERCSASKIRCRNISRLRQPMWVRTTTTLCTRPRRRPRCPADCSACSRCRRATHELDALAESLWQIHIERKQFRTIAAPLDRG